MPPSAWSRSRQFTADTKCLDEITNAMNKYSCVYARLCGEVLDAEFREMAAVRANMDPKVILLAPCWPRLS
jgi:hypothetical protein